MNQSNPDYYDYQIVTEKTPDDIDYRIYFKNQNGDIISPFHHVILYPVSHSRDIVNMVVEIPKYTNLKMEISKEIVMNPIIYDRKNEKIRKVNYKKGYPAHYGALPQTWENCLVKDKFTNIPGDNDPMDCFDISDLPVKSGDIIQLKVLGCVAMIDQSEMDWKMIGINCADPLSEKYLDMGYIPNDKMAEIIDFLCNYKLADGKLPNTFYEKMFWTKKETLDIIEEQHRSWKELHTLSDHEKPLHVQRISLHDIKTYNM